ncbi:dihydroorotase [Thermincola potens]|uniref:Dihydroorotase n=1 Tax=Thermincola potens (strain JR) TaxID=635013 RepID=D5X7W1_THEPJ|nr:dihydroorotase [Thermincola potens]ADG82681.1 dihydroorotase, multifunctional complex type [Thermincola potens JR]
MNLLIKGGRVVDPANNMDQVADIYITNGKIASVGAQIDVSRHDCEVIDAQGKWVFPGFIDMHVHLREPGYEAKETIATGTRAAARGGFTSVACMPNTNPVIDNRALVEFVKAKALAEGVVHVFPIGAITKGSRGEELAEIGDMYQAGAVAISDDGQPVANAQLMRLAMQYAMMFDIPIISHCEDKQLVADGVMNEGYCSTLFGLRGITRAAEEIMVARDILLAEVTGAKLHIAHVSTRGSVELVRMAKKKGLRVTAEATPHHFTLTEEAVGNYDTSTKVNPPLRSAEDVQAVKEGLKDGTIDIIATDHAPHTVEEKDVEYNYAPFGMIGLETAWGLIYEELVEKGILDLKEAVAKLTVRPAAIFGLQGKGSLTVGYDGDITIIDPALEETVNPDNFASKARNSAFIGRRLKALPVYTIVQGKIVMNNRILQKEDKL